VVSPDETYEAVDQLFFHVRLSGGLSKGFPVTSRGA